MHDAQSRVYCDLGVVSGSNGTALTVTFASGQYSFEGTLPDGNTFTCVYDEGTGSGEIDSNTFLLYVDGTSNADDVDSEDAHFPSFTMKGYGGADRAICPDDVDTIHLTLGDGADCWVDECGFVNLGGGDDTAVFYGPANDYCTGAGCTQCVDSAPPTSTYFSDQIKVYGESGDDCIFGTSSGSDWWVGGSGDDLFDGRGSGGAGDGGTGGLGADSCNAGTCETSESDNWLSLNDCATSSY